MEYVNIFSEIFRKSVENGVKNINLEDVEEKSNENSDEKRWESQNSNNMCCSYCHVEFHDIVSQREHYKLDWHRFNLKKSLQQKPPITEKEFEIKNENDDLSSISGSDSEPETQLETFNTLGKVLLKTTSEQVISMYKCLLFSRKEELDNQMLENRLNYCMKNTQWAVFLLGGGHFACAIFKETTPLLHKTFHCYTVRQGQGGSQRSRDAKSGSAHPKSAGASLRRYNEQALVQHVQGILEQWEDEIRKTGIIFYRASGPYNQTVLFGGNNKILEKSDERLRVIPFSTRRATFKEVQRVHSLLATVQSYGKLDDAIKHFELSKVQKANLKRNKLRSPQINRAKSRELPERPLPTKHSSETNSLAESVEDFDVSSLEIVEKEISFEHLREYSNTKVPRKLKKVRKKTNIEEINEKMKLIEISTKGDLMKFKEIYEKIGENAEEEAQKELRKEFMNQTLDKNKNTLLHFSAQNEREDFLKYLLENHGDPCRKNVHLQTPYTCTQSKTIRDIMKKFAEEYPERHDYNKAQIPTTTLKPEELEERKRLRKMIKREREKIKRREKKEKQAEETEKERFLRLSDREKRALAAERRILSQNGKVMNRCFSCAIDITGKVPFQYSDYQFCSIECLKVHKLKKPTN